jgi:hypothetical protein
MAAYVAAATAVALLLAGGLAYRSFSGPAASARALAAAANISGKWVSSTLTNPYDRNQKSVLHFEFEQAGEALFGVVTEKSDFGAAPKGIQGGRVKGRAIVFFTRGRTTTGNGEQPYKEHYRGMLKGGLIEFIRQNDVASGGLPERFIARRE